MTTALEAASWAASICEVTVGRTFGVGLCADAELFTLFLADLVGETICQSASEEI